MMKIYSVEEAQSTILRRRTLNRNEYSPHTIEATEKLFGPGVSPPQAVETILESVYQEGDQALRKWSRILDQYDGEEIRIPESRLEGAWFELPPR
jgi:histidinol dehydrogenase